MNRREEEPTFIGAIVEELDKLGTPEQDQWSEARALLERAFRSMEGGMTDTAQRGAA